MHSLKIAAKSGQWSSNSQITVTCYSYSDGRVAKTQVRIEHGQGQGKEGGGNVIPLGKLESSVGPNDD